MVFQGAHSGHPALIRSCLCIAADLLPIICQVAAAAFTLQALYTRNLLDNSYPSVDLLCHNSLINSFPNFASCRHRI